MFEIAKSKLTLCEPIRIQHCELPLQSAIAHLHLRHYKHTC